MKTPKELSEISHKANLKKELKHKEKLPALLEAVEADMVFSAEKGNTSLHMLKYYDLNDPGLYDLLFSTLKKMGYDTDTQMSIIYWR